MSDEDKNAKPEDEQLDGKASDLAQDEEGADDDDELDGEFDSDLIDAARTVGLNPSDYDDEDELYRETQTKIRELETSSAPAGDSEADKALDLLALEVALKDKGDLDEGLVSALEKLAVDSGANFDKLVKQLEHRTAGDQALNKRVDQLTSSVSTLVAQNIQLRLDRWVGRSEDSQGYLGKGDTNELDTDGKHARRRRALVRRAQKIAGRQRGSFTMEQMFSKAFKKMQGDRKLSDKSGKTKEPTRLARASSSKSTDLVDSSGASEETMNREAADVVAKFRRNAK